MNDLLHSQFSIVWWS